MVPEPIILQPSQITQKFHFFDPLKKFQPMAQWVCLLWLSQLQIITRNECQLGKHGGSQST